MYTTGYNENHDMGDLVAENHSILLIMSRFGIGLGFGDRSVGEVCRENGIHTDTFLAVVNLLLDGSENGYEPDPLALVDYLQRSHKYFLEFRLPAIRQNLLAVLTDEEEGLNKVLIGYFDEYIREVGKHMKYEERKVFPYVVKLAGGVRDEEYRISVFGTKHDQVESRLSEFKNILLKYYPVKSTNEVNVLLYNIYNCEHDLASHNAVEDKLLVPMVTRMEQNAAGR